MLLPKRSLTKLSLLLALATLCLSGNAHAESRDRSLLKSNMTERDIIMTLTTEAPQGSEVSVFFPIEFALNSAKLNQDAVKNLAKIGVALQSPELRNLSIVVEGHTDASGAAAYNQKLSERRAMSAADFLASLGIAKTRLKVVGRGEDDPIDNLSPYAAKQRRVEIVRVF